MNKYQEALGFLKESAYENYLRHYVQTSKEKVTLFKSSEALQKLVDRATPYKIQGNGYAQQKWSDYKKLEFSLKTNEELNYMYGMISKLVMVCLKRKIPLIIENPYQYDHYLTNYWPLKSSFIDTDRHKNGDYFKKPTQYWFIGLEPKNNLPGDAIAVYKRRTIKHTIRKERSMISPEYAKRFIKMYIVDAERGRI